MALQELLSKVPPYHAGQPKFMEMLARVLEPFARAEAFVKELPTHFDIDVAVGVQLDTVGVWVGRSRRVPIPLPGIYFSFGDALRGFGLGVWKGPYDTAVGVSLLSDDVYRRLLYANIAAKHWDGTVPDAQRAFDIFFIDPDTHVFVQDNAEVPFPRRYFAFGVEGQGFSQGFWRSNNLGPSIEKADLSMTVGVSGKIPEPVLLSLLGIGAIPIKPAGVETRYRVTTVNRKPLFGFGVNNDYVAGFGSGAWGMSPEKLLNR